MCSHFIDLPDDHASQGHHRRPTPDPDLVNIGFAYDGLAGRCPRRSGSRLGQRAAMVGWLELFRGLVEEVPGDLGGVAGVVGLVGAPGDGVAAEVAPAEDELGEDPDRGAAGGAERDGSSSSGSSAGAGATAVKAISKASGSIMLRYARAAWSWSVVALARRSARLRAAASRSGWASRAGWVMMVHMAPPGLAGGV